MKKRVLTFVTGLALTGFVATAQETAEAPAAEAPATEEKSSGLEISGSIDTYYRTTVGVERGTAPGSSFANANQFGIGMANVVLAKEGEKTGFVADLAFGPRGNDAVFGSTVGTSPAVNQLYAYWMASDKVTLTLGNFNTFLGYEVISPTGNFNYSTSYMFSYGPFSHTGLKADIGLTDELSLMVGVFNQTDATESNPINNLSVGTQLGYTVDAGGIWLNYLGGNQQGVDGSGITTHQVDLTAGFDATEALYLGVNATYNWVAGDNVPTGVDPSFMGAALYAQYTFSDVFALGFRGEYFSESDYYLAASPAASATGAVYDADGKATIIDLTLSGNIFLGDLTLIPEVRIDMPSEDSYITSDGTDVTNVLPSLMLAAVYSF